MSIERRTPISWAAVQRSVFWIVGLGLVVNEAFIVPPTSFRLAVLLVGGLMAGIPGIEIARALWSGAVLPPAPPAPPSPSALPPSPPATPSPTSGPG